jgi:hypothetical protein
VDSYKPNKGGRKKGSPKPPGSGRKKGTKNKFTPAVKELSQRYGEEIIDELYRIATSSASDGDRIQAAKELLNRGYGKAPNPIHLGNFEGGPFDITMILKVASPEQIKAFIGGLTTEHLVLLSQKFVETIAVAEGRPPLQ